MLVDALKEQDEDQFFALAQAMNADLLARIPHPLDPDDRDPDDDASAWWDRGTVDEDTLLCEAARYGCPRVVAHLLALGEDPNHLGNSRVTALAAYVFQSFADQKEAEATAGIMVQLLHAGADPDLGWDDAAGQAMTGGISSARSLARRKADRLNSTWALWVLEEWWPAVLRQRALDDQLPPSERPAAPTPRL